MTLNERPILFSMSMIQAILRGEKTQTRRIANFIPLEEGLNLGFSGLSAGHYCTGAPKSGWVLYSRDGGGCWNQRTKPLMCPYGQPGDILWVRETWAKYQTVDHIRRPDGRAFSEVSDGQFAYRADGFDTIEDLRTHIRLMSDCDCEEVLIGGDKWHPGIHMPRAAARLFLRVEDVRVERLQSITEEDAKAEGVDYCCPSYRHRGWNDKWISGYCHDCKHNDPMTGKRPTCYFRHSDDESRFRWWCGCSSGSFELRDDAIPEPYRFKFAFVWDEALKPPFWDSNPWVWIVSFKRLDGYEREGGDK